MVLRPLAIQVFILTIYQGKEEKEIDKEEKVTFDQSQDRFFHFFFWLRKAQ